MDKPQAKNNKQNICGRSDTNDVTQAPKQPMIENCFWSLLPSLARAVLCAAWPATNAGLPLVGEAQSRLVIG